MIHHSVILNLKHPKGSAEEAAFIKGAKLLAKIPNVLNFKVSKQVSTKNYYDFGISMDFANQKHYDTYSNHPDHEAFIQKYWVKDVADYLEIDYVEI